MPTSCGGCLNGGICGKLETGKKCFCSQCWTGDKCEIRIKGCLRPCKNGGTYIDGLCHCAAGYFGSQCESSNFIDLFFLSFFLSFFLYFLINLFTNNNSSNMSCDYKCKWKFPSS